MKQIVKLNEAQLRNVVAESVKRVLKEHNLPQSWYYYLENEIENYQGEAKGPYDSEAEVRAAAEEELKAYSNNEGNWVATIGSCNGDITTFEPKDWIYADNFIYESVFSHKENEFGRDYVEEMKQCATGILNALAALEDEGNSNSYQAVQYLINGIKEKVGTLQRLVPLISKYVNHSENSLRRLVMGKN
ncbi:MAG: hypothetical protein IKZ51_05010 [Bacteroidales bacterium]|nr:hypothetical protein [Bacteroidales bacterium]